MGSFLLKAFPVKKRLFFFFSKRRISVENDTLDVSVISLQHSSHLTVGVSRFFFPDSFPFSKSSNKSGKRQK